MYLHNRTPSQPGNEESDEQTCNYYIHLPVLIAYFLYNTHVLMADSLRHARSY